MEKKTQELYMIGNAHIDPVWLWNWQEGFQEIKATFQSVLDRMEEYDDFIFTGSSAAFYQWVEENEPEMFARIRERVRERRWVICGGWWIQPDCNAPGGESFIRQGLYGQRYFQERFGVMARCGYNVDSFGHNGMLPQILRKSGMDRYVFMRPGRHEKGLPEETFWWQSKDGARVLAYRLPFEYCTWPDQIESHVRRCSGELKGIDGIGMCFYGVGNHGGGPTKKNIESLHKMAGQPQFPQLYLTHPDAYFEAIEKIGKELPVVGGDLLHHASGCYSAHSEIKALNRKTESRLDQAERLAVLAEALLGRPYPLQRFTKAWKEVLFNQFHDTLSGTSLRSAYDDARESYGYALHTAAKELNHALQGLTWRIHIPYQEGDRPLVVFNTQGFPAAAAVEVEMVTPKPAMTLQDDQGREIDWQIVQSEAASRGRSRVLFMADLPAMGYGTYHFINPEETGEAAERERSAADRKQSGAEYKCLAADQVCSDQVKMFDAAFSEGILKAGDNFAENQWLRIEWEEQSGDLSSIFHKESGTEFLAGPGAVPVVIRDESDTWSHDVRVFADEVGVFTTKRVKLAEQGKLKAVIRVESEYNRSEVVQDFQIYRDLDYVKVKVRINWQEQRKMLKLQFPLNLNYLRGTYEIPYGTACREPSGEEFPIQSFIDFEGAASGMETPVCGLSIINDGKFSCSAQHKKIRLTALRSPIYAHHQPYEPEEEVRYEYLDQGIQTFQYIIYPHSGKWEEADTVKLSRLLNQPPITLFETFHEGPFEQRRSFVHISNEKIMLTAWKAAEDGSGDRIMRFLETAGSAQTADVMVLEREFSLAFTPGEIKTVRVPLESSRPVKEVNLLEYDM